MFYSSTWNLQILQSKIGGLNGEAKLGFWPESSNESPWNSRIWSLLSLVFGLFDAVHCLLLLKMNIFFDITVGIGTYWHHYPINYNDKKPSQLVQDFVNCMVWCNSSSFIGFLVFCTASDCISRSYLRPCDRSLEQTVSSIWPALRLLFHQVYRAIANGYQFECQHDVPWPNSMGTWCRGMSF